MSAGEQPPLWTQTVQLGLSDLVRYAGASGDFNPIHYDDAFARSMGLPGVIVHGMFSMGIVARLVREHEPEPIRLVRISARFLGVLLPDHDIRASCRPMAGEHPAGTRGLEVELCHPGAAGAGVSCQVLIAPDGAPRGGGGSA